MAAHRVHEEKPDIVLDMVLDDSGQNEARERFFIGDAGADDAPPGEVAEAVTKVENECSDTSIVLTVNDQQCTDIQVKI